MDADHQNLIRLLRAELTAVHQQFCHMLALRQWKGEDVLPRITQIDTRDFRNAMRIIDLIVSRGQSIELDSHRIAPGSDVAAILRSELSLEESFAGLLAGLDMAGPEARALLDRAAEPRPTYREWLAARLDGEPPAREAPDTGPQTAEFLAHLIALVEQPMLRAFVLWHSGHRAEADDAWRLSGAAMLYGTALVRRGALTHAVPTPASIPAVRTVPEPSAAFEADIELARRCAELGRAAADAEADEPARRLCLRIAEDCDLIAGMDMGTEFPAVFGRSPVFESFAATRGRQLN